MNDEYDADLRRRTKQYSSQIVQFFRMLPRTSEAEVMGKQILRSGTSVGAHYREAYRSRSLSEFISKLEGGLQELEETAYWLELLNDTKNCPPESVVPLQRETDELIAIFVQSCKTAKRRREREK